MLSTTSSSSRATAPSSSFTSRAGDVQDAGSAARFTSLTNAGPKPTNDSTFGTATMKYSTRSVVTWSGELWFLRACLQKWAPLPPSSGHCSVHCEAMSVVIGPPCRGWSWLEAGACGTGITGDVVPPAGGWCQPTAKSEIVGSTPRNRGGRVTVATDTDQGLASVATTPRRLTRTDRRPAPRRTGVESEPRRTRHRLDGWWHVRHAVGP